jgi:hypothetical protein
LFLEGGEIGSGMNKVVSVLSPEIFGVELDV